MDMNKIFGRFVTNDYSFLTYVKDGLVFLVMVEAGVEMIVLSTKIGLQSAS